MYHRNKGENCGKAKGFKLLQKKEKDQRSVAP